MNTKTCPSCSTVKSVDDFNKNKARKDGLGVNCRDCMKILRKSHYERNKDRYIQESGRRRDESKLKVIENLHQYLVKNPCVDCGNSDPRVLEFDHRNRQTKFKNVSAMIAENYSWSKIFVEVQKCDVRCANCHRIKTHIENDSFRAKWM